MIIHWYCPAEINSGKPWDDSSYEGGGLGGAESQVVILSRELSRQGHDVTIYVSEPINEGKNKYGVKWEPLKKFSIYQPRDVFVLHRAWMAMPGMFREVQAWIKVFFSCDQYTSGHWTEEIYPYMDAMFFISPYHKTYIKTFCASSLLEERKLYITDLAVENEKYQVMKKEKNSLIFCSVPMRGLDFLAEIMPVVWASVPDAKLTITSDYRLWGVPYAGNEESKLKFANMPNVRFLGKIPKNQVAEEQLRAEIMAYPCNYDENFCIAAAECQAAGAVPVTTGVGALETTVENGKSGILINGLPYAKEYKDRFAGEIVRLLTVGRPDLERMREYGRERAFDRYSAKTISEKLVENFKEIISKKEGKQ